jgi:hypothetical protein
MKRLLLWVSILGFWGGMVGSWAFTLGWLGMEVSRPEALAEERLAIGWACAAALLWLARARDEG